MDAYYGEIRIFAGSYAPRDWAFCNGQTMNIREYPGLFGVLGTIYGGDGRNTFNLPNLAGTTVIGTGTGYGLTPRTLGHQVGATSYNVGYNNLPRHNHSLNGAQTGPLTTSPLNGYVAQGVGTGRSLSAQYSDDTSGQVALSPSSISATGSLTPAPVPNIQPLLPLNFIICLMGNWPPKP